MKSLIGLMEQEFNVISEVATHSQAFMQGSYTTFHARFGFEKTEIPKLDLEMARTKLKLLVFETEQFCNDPINLYGTEKKWMIRRFWRMLVEEARQIFADARAETERWLNETPLRLETQMKDHKIHLQQRLDSMASLNARTENIDGELRKLLNQRKLVQDQATMITDLIVKLRETAPPKV
jgi:hypothetical protein